MLHCTLYYTCKSSRFLLILWSEVKLKYKSNHTCRILIFVCTLWNSSIIIQIVSFAFDKLSSLSLALVSFKHSRRRTLVSLTFYILAMATYNFLFKVIKAATGTDLDLVYNGIMNVFGTISTSLVDTLTNTTVRCKWHQISQKTKINIMHSKQQGTN